MRDDQLTHCDASRFLKLMLGIAVTCSNKQTFIGKIQTLEESVQHSLTQCVASFIIVKVSIIRYTCILLTHVSRTGVSLVTWTRRPRDVSQLRV